MFNPFEENANVLAKVEPPDEGSVVTDDQANIEPVDEGSVVTAVDESNMTEEEKALAAEKDRKFKEGKRAAAKRHAEKVKALADKRVEAAKLTKAYLQDSGIWENAPAEIKEFVEGFTKAQVLLPTTSNVSFFSKLFGDNAEVGSEITLLDAYKQTYKDKTTIDRYIKKWAAQGIVVEFVADQANPLESKYVVKQLAA